MGVGRIPPHRYIDGNCCLSLAPFQICDIAAGEYGYLDTRPVTPETLFPCYGASRIATSAALQRLADKSMVRWSDRISQHWDEFSGGGKAECTISDLMRCRSGVEAALPDTLNTNSFAKEEEQLIEFVSAAEPLILPSLVAGDAARRERIEEELLDEAFAAGRDTPAISMDEIQVPWMGPSYPHEQVAHLWFGWGWASAGLLCKVAACSPQEAVHRHVTEPLSLKEELIFGIPDDRPDQVNRIARMTLGKGEDMTADDMDASDVGSRASAAFPTAAAAASTTSRGAGDGASVSGSARHSVAAASTHGSGADDNSDAGESEPDESGAMGIAMAAMELAGIMAEAGLEDLGPLTSGGKEHLMDPRLLNWRKLRAATIPSTNLYATARALAKVGSYICQRQKAQCELEPKPELQGLSVAQQAALQACREQGFRLVEMQQPDGSHSSSWDRRRMTTSVGMFAMGGTGVLIDCESNTTIAITVNRLTPSRYVSSILTLCTECSGGWGGCWRPDAGVTHSGIYRT